MTTRLQASGLVAGYGRVPVLRNLELTVSSGEIVMLTGPNGAGKTTLNRVLAGALRQTSGTVELIDNGAHTSLDRLGLAARARLGLGYLPQRSALLWDLTVRHNLEAARLSPAARRRSQKPPAIDTLLATYGLNAVAEQRASQLSGGQARRLELGRLAAMGSRILICDEPLAGLDDRGCDSVCEAFEVFVAEGAGILVTDHRARKLLSIAHRHVELEHGAVVAEQQLKTPDLSRAASRLAGVA